MMTNGCQDDSECATGYVCDIGICVEEETEESTTEVCGDRTCDPYEQMNPSLCPEDCATTETRKDIFCGDGICDAQEDATTCPDDCTTTAGYCGDGICDAQEDATTCPDDCTEIIDTDGDEISDYEEINIYGSDPNSMDTDGDGYLTDYEEVYIYATDPVKEDSDNDVLSDVEEIYTYDTDPTIQDTDGNGMHDYIEAVIAVTDPNDATDIDSYTILDFDIDNVFTYTTHYVVEIVDKFSNSENVIGYAVGNIKVEESSDEKIASYINLNTARDDYIYFTSALDYAYEPRFIVHTRVLSKESGSHQTIVLSPTITCFMPAFYLEADTDTFRLQVTLDGDKYEAVGGEIKTNQWQDIIGWYTGTSLYLYVDGELVDKVSASGSFPSFREMKNVLIIGHADPDCGTETDDFEGFIDFVKIWHHT